MPISSQVAETATNDEHAAPPGAAPGGPLATPATSEGREAAEDEGEEA